MKQHDDEVERRVAIRKGRDRLEALVQEESDHENQFEDSKQNRDRDRQKLEDDDLDDDRDDALAGRLDHGVLGAVGKVGTDDDGAEQDRTKNDPPEAAF